jgi:putative oxidoreductase
METTFARHWAVPLRILLGISFMVHGAPKVFDAQAHHEFQGMLGQLGVPASTLMAWVVGVVEFFGGAALVLGVFTWIAAGLLVIEMIAAALLVHGPNGWSAVHIVGTSDRGPIFGMPGWEYNMLYVAGLLALFIGGPGPLSIDARVPRAERALRAPWWRERRVHA